VGQKAECFKAKESGTHTYHLAFGV